MTLRETVAGLLGATVATASTLYSGALQALRLGVPLALGLAFFLKLQASSSLEPPTGGLNWPPPGLYSSIAAYYSLVPLVVIPYDMIRARKGYSLGAVAGAFVIEAAASEPSFLVYALSVFTIMAYTALGEVGGHAYSLLRHRPTAILSAAAASGYYLALAIAGLMGFGIAFTAPAVVASIAVLSRTEAGELVAAIISSNAGLFLVIAAASFGFAGVVYYLGVLAVELLKPRSSYVRGVIVPPVAREIRDLARVRDRGLGGPGEAAALFLSILVYPVVYGSLNYAYPLGSPEEALTYRQVGVGIAAYLVTWLIVRRVVRGVARHPSVEDLLRPEGALKSVVPHALLASIIISLWSLTGSNPLALIARSLGIPVDYGEPLSAPLSRESVLEYYGGMEAFFGDLLNVLVRLVWGG